MLRTKRILVSLLTCIVVFAMLTSFTSVSASSVGDVNQDSSINASDATRILLHTVGKISLSNSQQDNADVNGDGMVNAMDATLILLHAVGKKQIKPSEESTNYVLVDGMRAYLPNLWSVGTDMPAGEYVIVSTLEDDADELSMVRVSSDADGEDTIIIADFESNYIVTAYEGEYLYLLNCFAVPSDDFYIQASIKPQSGAMLKVGVDIPAGEYRVIADDFSEDDPHGNVFIFNSSRQTVDELVSINSVSASGYFYAEFGQYILLDDCLILDYTDIEYPGYSVTDSGVIGYWPGQLKVGTDIPAGEYIVVPEYDDSPARVYISSDANSDDILFDIKFEDYQVITVKDGEYLSLVYCYAMSSENFPNLT